MPTFGVTPTGFVIRTLENLNTLVIGAVQSAIGVLPVDALLVLIQIFNDRIAELWQLGEAVYNAGDVDAATGEAQDVINSITGTIRDGARSSTTLLTWTGNPGVNINSLTTRAKTNISLQPFVVTGLLVGTVDITTTPYVIVGLPAWVGSTAYAVGDRVTNAARCYVCKTAGTSAVSGGPGSQAATIPDGAGTLVWGYLGDGTGAVDLAAAAVFTGPLTALSGSINVIDTPLAGVLGVINVLDALLGADVETDADYRVRREFELAQPGSGTAAAITAAVVEIDGASNITVFQNTTDFVNVDGMPGHSVELLVLGGDSEAIARVLLDNIDAAISTTGNTTVIFTDDQGFLQTIKFSRPVQKLVYNTLGVTYDARSFPVNGSDQIKSAIVAYGVVQKCGVDGRPYQIGRAAGGVLGVLEVTSNLISVFPVTVPVSGANIVVSLRELVVYDTSRIIVNLTPGTP